MVYACACELHLGVGQHHLNVVAMTRDACRVESREIDVCLDNSIHGDGNLAFAEREVYVIVVLHKLSL